MKKIAIAVIATAFAATSLGAFAQDKKDVKSAQGGNVAAPSGSNVTTGGGKPAEAKKGGKLPENQGKRKDEKQRTEKK